MDQVAQVREKIDIVSLIQEYLPIKKLGRNFKTTCPFHTEKTPSFVVSPERQIWHCFGCGKGGDAYSFLMEYENLEFPEALRILARKTGIELRESAQWSSGIASQKEKIYAVNRLASEFYHYILMSHPAGKRAKEYLEKRGVSKAAMQAFMIGFAPQSGRALITYLIEKKQYKKEDLFDAGLSTIRSGRLEDFFAGRVMFPLCDHRGNVLGFSGRVLNGSTGYGLGAKYVNTRETAVYHKGSHFFGLSIAKEEIKKTSSALIVEGEFDVIACFQNNIKNTIALKGTAFTESQAQLIARFSPKVTLCFDADSAGQEAIKKSVQVLEKKGLIATVVIPEGKDADEALTQNPLHFKQALKEDMNAYDFLLQKTLGSYSAQSGEGKKEITDELLPLYGVIENEIVKEHYLKKLAMAVGASYETILRQLTKTADKPLSVQEKTAAQAAKRTRVELLEEYLFAMIIQQRDPLLFIEDVEEYLADYVFVTPVLQKIMNHLKEYAKHAFDLQTFAASLLPELKSAFDVCFLLPVAKFNSPEDARDEAIRLLKELKRIELKSKIKELTRQLTLHEEQKDEKMATQLQGEIGQLLERMRTL